MKQIIDTLPTLIGKSLAQVAYASNVRNRFVMSVAQSEEDYDLLDNMLRIAWHNREATWWLDNKDKTPPQLVLDGDLQIKLSRILDPVEPRATHDVSELFENV